MRDYFQEDVDLTKSCSPLLAFAHVPLARFHKKEIPMAKRMIWVEDETFTGWCCSHCTWGITAPKLHTTVAALAFNRVAQENFDKHQCVDRR